MRVEDLPHLTVVSLKKEEDRILVECKLDSLKWVGDNHRTYLFFAGNLVEGRFRKLNEPLKKVFFEPAETDSIPLIKKGQSWQYIDYYWGNMVAIVLDESLKWESKEFAASDAVVTEKRGDSVAAFRELLPEDDNEALEVIKGGWEHEHCDICGFTISESENPVYMATAQEDMLCLECYDNFVVKKSLDFIPDE